MRRKIHATDRFKTPLLQTFSLFHYKHHYNLKKWFKLMILLTWKLGRNLPMTARKSWNNKSIFVGWWLKKCSKISTRSCGSFQWAHETVSIFLCRSWKIENKKKLIKCKCLKQCQSEKGSWYQKCTIFMLSLRYWNSHDRNQIAKKVQKQTCFTWKIVMRRTT